MGPNKAVHVMFFSGGIILFGLLALTGDWIASSVTRTPNDFIVNGIALAVALAVGIGAYRNERVNTLAFEVAGELQKVTWPTRAETQAATLVVLVTVVIAAAILGLFDAVWSTLTDLVYG